MSNTTTTALPQTSTTTWNIDPAHSIAEFKVKHHCLSFSVQLRYN
jgi:polyisoprenoid-binding protein YceI